MKRRTLCGSVVLLAIAAIAWNSDTFAQETKPERQTKANAEASKTKPVVLTFIEIRSVIPESEKTATDEKSRRIRRFGLSYADVDRILEAIPAIRDSVAIREIHKPIRTSNRSVDGRIVGTTASYSTINHLEMDRGRFLSKNDNDKYQNFAVLGSELARSLVAEQDPIGKAVKLGTDYYTIIGVVKERAQTSVISGRSAPRDVNKDVYIPLNTCKLRFGERIVVSRPGEETQFEESQLSRLTLQLRDDASVEDTAALIRSTLLKPFHPKGDVEVIVVRVHDKSR